MGIGRPTKYTPELLEAAQAYVDGMWEDSGDVVPTIVGLALDIGINEETAHRWGKEEGKEDFSKLLTRVKDMQQRALLSGSLAGNFNPVISKMMLSKHGWIEKQEVEQKNFNVNISGDDADL